MRGMELRYDLFHNIHLTVEDTKIARDYVLYANNFIVTFSCVF